MTLAKVKEQDGMTRPNEPRRPHTEVSSTWPTPAACHN